jgi:hypothetical protein
MLSPDIEERLKRLEDITDYRSIRVSPTIKCISCGVYIFLDTDVYRDVEDIDIRCKACKGLHRISMKDGHLTKLSLQV